MTTIIAATYQEHPIEELNNNPFTESLKVIFDEKEAIKLLTKIPNTNIEDLSTIYQNMRINSLKDLHIPHPSSFNIYQKIMELVLMGYSTRNPLSANHTKLLYAIALKAKVKQRFTPEISSITSAPSSLASGPSGSGKSTTIRNTLALIPQVIKHQEYKNNVFHFDQLVWISFDCPATSSPKALTLNFMKQVDNALGTTYYKEWSAKSRESVDSHFAGIQLIASRHGLGFVHIDELQFLLSYRNCKDSPSLSTLESLFNKIGIPVLLTCTSAGLTLFESSDSDECTLTRRMVSERDYRFSTLDPKSKHFDTTFDALFPETLCINSVKPDSDFKERFHYLTAGLPAVMNRLARLHHEFVIKNKHSVTGDINILGNIFKHQFVLIEPALQYLRIGNIASYEQVLQKNTESKGAWTDSEVKQSKSKKESESKPDSVPRINSQSTATSAHTNAHASNGRNGDSGKLNGGAI